MKKVLILVHDFPPVGGGRVLRTLKFTKYLPHFGWKPIVVTTEYKKRFPKDVTLLNELSSEVQIYRTRTFEPSSVENKIKKMLDVEQWKGLCGFCLRCNNLIKSSLLNYVLIPDKSIGWLVYALRKCNEVIKEHNPVLVFSTSPPHSTHLVGYLIAKKKNLPFVADFRDGWIGNPLFSSRIKFRNKIEIYLERIVISKAKYIISSTQPITEHFIRRYKNFRSEKFVTIPNGFDKADFKEIRKYAPKYRDKMCITYTGSIGYQRSPRYFLEAVSELIRENPVVREKMRIRFVGEFLDDKNFWLSKKGLSRVVSFEEHIPHRDCVKLMLQSDVLLIILFPEEGGETMTAGKIYEYIGAKKPILALVPDCVAANIINNYKIGIVVAPNDRAGIKRALLKMFDAWEKDKLRITEKNELRYKFDRKELTGKLAGVFEKCLRG